MYAYTHPSQMSWLSDIDSKRELVEEDCSCKRCFKKTVDSYLSIACDNFTALGKSLQIHGQRSLTDYLNAIQPQSNSAFQSRDDLLDIVHSQVQPYFGVKIAQQTVSDLEQVPMVLTANHHGVTYFAQDFQGNLIFALNRMGADCGLNTVPVFACGTVPLDNLTFPLGMLCYHTNSKYPQMGPSKIPIFSNKMRRQMVSCAKPFDNDMITRAQKRAKKLIAEGVISSTLDAPIQCLLDHEYKHSLVMGFRSYTQQSVVLNNRIWKRLFRLHRPAPELINLELEKVAIALLEKDLTNSDTLAHSVMFDKKLRENVFNALDGKRACWQTKFLLRRLHADCSETDCSGAVGCCGTMLFWGLDERRRRIPLYLSRERSGKEVLCGIDDRGNMHEMPYTVTSILEGLQKEQLLPSIFTSLLSLSLARGVICAGGYFQCDYLPTMKNGLVKALKQTNGYDDLAAYVHHIKTDTYLSGMIAVMRRVEEEHLVPAGPIEIIAGGGLDDAAIRKMQSLTLRDAHIGAMADTIQDLPGQVKATLPTNWRFELVKAAEQILTEKIALV